VPPAAAEDKRVVIACLAAVGSSVAAGGLLLFVEFVPVGAWGWVEDASCRLEAGLEGEVAEVDVEPAGDRFSCPADPGFEAGTVVVTRTLLGFESVAEEGVIGGLFTASITSADGTP
jgi:hypothetical protein